VSKDNSNLIIDPVQVKSYFLVLTVLAQNLKTKVTFFERNRRYPDSDSDYIEKGYLLTAKSLKSRLELINYFSKFPLLSSKHMDYFNWYKAHEIVIYKRYRNIEVTTELIRLKSSMNSLRSELNWDYLLQVFNQSKKEN
jgi:LAGLIDADG endonuclease